MASKRTKGPTNRGKAAPRRKQAPPVALPPEVEAARAKVGADFDRRFDAVASLGVEAMRRLCEDTMVDEIERRDERRLAAIDDEQRYGRSLADTGAVAMLLGANVDTDEGVRRFVSRFAYAPGVTPPNQEQLQTARRILRALDVAIVAGSQPKVWTAIADGWKAIARATSIRRMAVVHICEQWTEDHAKLWQSLWRGQRERAGIDGPEVMAEVLSRVKGDLADIDAAFATVTATSLVAAIRPDSQHDPSAIGMAARLSLACGALGDVQQPHESYERAYRRVRRSYEKAAKGDN